MNRELAVEERQFIEWEQGWREGLPNYSESQWLQIFPKLLSAFKYKVSARLEKNKKLYQSEQEYRRLVLGKKLVIPYEEHWEIDLIIEIIDESLKKIEKEIKRDKWILFTLSNEQTTNPFPDKITDNDITRAKTVPISNFIQINKFNTALCPFHTEKHASFKIFKDNHWYCFGACSTGGDVIDFIQKLYGYNFIQAVKYLIVKK